MFSFGSFIVVFREGFEMAVVISIILAATNRQIGSKKYIFSGVIIGLLASIAIGAISFSNEYLIKIIETDITGAIILLLISILIIWTILFMKAQGKKLSSDFKAIANLQHSSQPYILFAISALTILREGVEVVVFLIGIVGKDVSAFGMFTGGLLGALLAVIFGFLMYFGFVKLNIKKVFGVLSFLMSFLVAGMVAHAIRKLISAGIIGGIINPLWDSSSFLNHETNWFGRFIYVLFGYYEKPSLTELLFYIGTLVLIYILIKYRDRKEIM